MATITTQPEQLITKEELAKRLNLSVAGVKNLIYRRAIPVLRLGHRTIRFRWSEIEVAIDRCRQAEISFSGKLIFAGTFARKTLRPSEELNDVRDIL